jgi:hypothetical protein
MSRKSLIICLAVLAVMALVVGIGVTLLYSGINDVDDHKAVSVPDQGRYLLLPAVPSDAVVVGCFSQAKTAMR